MVLHDDTIYYYKSEKVCWERIFVVYQNNASYAHHYSVVFDVSGTQMDCDVHPRKKEEDFALHFLEYPC